MDSRNSMKPLLIIKYPNKGDIESFEAFNKSLKDKFEGDYNVIMYTANVPDVSITLVHDGLSVVKLSTDSL